MKLKLLALSIFFAILSLVAYQTYRETKVLKSIDSYESCVSAKGSIIQESYPATCITSLGTRFTENTWGSFTSSQHNFSVGYPTYSKFTTHKYSDGTEYYILFNSGENQQPYLQISFIISKIQPTQPLDDYIYKKYKIANGYTHNGSSPSKVIEFSKTNIKNHEAYLLIKEQKLNSEYNSYELFIRLNDKTVIVIDPGREPQNQEENELFNQILSTFKFTD